MMELIHTIASAIVIVTFFWGIWRFVIFRERYSFLHVAVSATTISHSGLLALVLVVVRIENRGNIRINARTTGRSAKGFLYDDGWDQCEHAGTLKIRRIPESKRLQHFNWYSLTPILLPYSLEIPETPDGKPQCDLEQINFLDEYQDPELEYRETHFWLEPKESYELSVSLWLPSGSYAAKAFFLGRERTHKEEEYWTHTTMFSVSRPGSKRAAVHGA
jgi:hypothetical protein